MDAQTKVELNIPQLTLPKLAQLGKHEMVNRRRECFSPRVTGSILVTRNFFAEYILL